MSHSTRVRGLKFIIEEIEKKQKKSHSTRVRGLKSSATVPLLINPCVALYTSAWIEICFILLKWQIVIMSHSTRVRGLKLQYRDP